MPEVTEEEYAQLEALRDNKNAANESEDVAEDKSEDESEDVPMIVHRQQYTDGEGNAQVKEHRMPVTEWTEYERKHNL